MNENKQKNENIKKEIEKISTGDFVCYKDDKLYQARAAVIPFGWMILPGGFLVRKGFIYNFNQKKDPYLGLAVDNSSEDDYIKVLLR